MKELQYFSSLKNQKKQILNLHKILQPFFDFWHEMETQNIVNLLDNTDNESSKFATRKWYVIIDQNNTKYGDGNENYTTIKFETKVIKAFLCGHSDAYIFATGDKTATNDDANTKFAFKNCDPFAKCINHINNEHVDNAENLNIIMPMYNLIEYSNSYSDTSGDLWQSKRDESLVTNAWNSENASTDGSTSFKHKTSFIENNGVLKNAKVAVPLKYLSNFWRSLEMPLINC